MATVGELRAKQDARRQAGIDRRNQFRKAREAGPVSWNTQNGIRTPVYNSITTNDGRTYNPDTKTLLSKTVTPTVLSDVNIRDKVIPDLNKRANNLTNTPTYSMQPGETPEQYNKRTSSGSSFDDQADNQTTGEDYYSKLLSGMTTGAGNSGSSLPEPEEDPIETQTLELLKSMKNSVDASADAQVQSIEDMYKVRKNQMQQSIGSEGAELRTALRAAGARYTPGSSGGAVSGAEQQGIIRLSQLDAEEKGAIAEVKAAQQQGNFQVLEKQLAIAERKREEKAAARKELMKQIADENKAIADAKAKIQEDIDKIAQDAAKGGASSDVIAAISSARSVTDAIKAAGNTLQTGTGTVGEYLFYKREAESLGQTPMTYQEYADMDANRKRSIVNMNSGGLNTTQSNQFLRITDKYQADPLIMAADKGNTAMAIADQVLADPSNAANQLKALYVLVKNLDPDSAVREGEISLANKTQSYLQQFGTSITRISKGQVISPEAAKELATATKDLVSTWQATASKRTNRYKSQAKNADPLVGNAFESYLTDFSNLSTNNDAIQTEEQAKQKIIDYGRTNPQQQTVIKSYLSQSDPLLGRPLTYSEIMQLLGIE